MPVGMGIENLSRDDCKLEARLDYKDQRELHVEILFQTPKEKKV